MSLYEHLGPIASLDDEQELNDTLGQLLMVMSVLDDKIGEILRFIHKDSGVGVASVGSSQLQLLMVMFVGAAQADWWGGTKATLCCTRAQGWNGWRGSGYTIHSACPALGHQTVPPAAVAPLHDPWLRRTDTQTYVRLPNIRTVHLIFPCCPAPSLCRPHD